MFMQTRSGVISHLSVQRDLLSSTASPKRMVAPEYSVGVSQRGSENSLMKIACWA